MVAFLFLFAPMVVLIAVLIMQRFQSGRDENPATLIERLVEDSRIEPRFGAVNDNAGYEPDSGAWLDQNSISSG